MAGNNAERAKTRIDMLAWYFVYLNNECNKKPNSRLNETLKKVTEKHKIVMDEPKNGRIRCYARGGVIFDVFARHYEAPLGGVSNLMGYEIINYGASARSYGRC